MPSARRPDASVCAVGGAANCGATITHMPRLTNATSQQVTMTTQASTGTIEATISAISNRPVR